MAALFLVPLHVEKPFAIANVIWIQAAIAAFEAMR
jgi:hypothetical protein